MAGSASSASARFRFAIDRGGTFTDVYAEIPTADGQTHFVKTMKLLSVDPSYDDAPLEAIRRVLREYEPRSVSDSGEVDPLAIEWIRMGTTVATNALLERNGERVAFITTKGFRDLLHIGNQSRPAIFDLKSRKPENLYECVVEVDERVQLMTREDAGQAIEQGNDDELVQGITGEYVKVIKDLDLDEVKTKLTEVYSRGIRSLAVAFLHSYTYRNHEQQAATIAKQLGFTHVTLSHEQSSANKILPRAYTACADAYLTPTVKQYIASFSQGFSSAPPLNFMKSDGGLAPTGEFSGVRAVLSGPAGGVVGYSRTAYQQSGGTAVIGFDMGGTSTDVSRYNGDLELIYDGEAAGITLQVPQLDINTVAAGGGSRLFFRGGMFHVGPESARAYPGPVCYRNGGPLAITDAQAVLGRLPPHRFPRIFGPSKTEGLDVSLAAKQLSELTEQINEFNQREGRAAMTMQEVALGFLKVANEAMTRPILSLTRGRGYNPSEHALSCFGGAGGNHACSMARSLGMRRVYVHRLAGILSAYGLALADVKIDEAQPVLEHLPPVVMTAAEAHTAEDSAAAQALDNLRVQLAELEKRAKERLQAQGFALNDIHTKRSLTIRYDGTDTYVKVSEAAGKTYKDISDDFRKLYIREYGFELSTRLVVEEVRVDAVGKSSAGRAQLKCQGTEEAMSSPVESYPIWFDASVVPTRDGLKVEEEQKGALLLRTPIYLTERCMAGQSINGPALLCDANTTVLVEPNCTATFLEDGSVEILLHDGDQPTQTDDAATNGVGGSDEEVIGPADPITLSVFGHRFMGIAEQMGHILSRTAISVNIKERLDFSCAIFGPDGSLVANAPHLPVHLGAMQEAVRYQIELLGNSWREGEVILCNHPAYGGSHLPDLTVITPVFHEGTRAVFYVASRGHHADVGGITPGSMPPFSKSIGEEGAAIRSFKLTEGGIFQHDATVALFGHTIDAWTDEQRKASTAQACQHGNIPAQPPTRRLQDNLSDLHAQVAANHRGVTLMEELIKEHGLRKVQCYMKYIQDASEESVKEMLVAMSHKNGLQLIDTLRGVDYMDDGSAIQLAITIDRTKRTATFDFTGTGPEVYGNLNCPRPVTASAIIYCLRSMLDSDIPLNQGCLKPVQIILPPHSLVNPSHDAAVVAGNVLTSQRITDIVLRTFRVVANSYGCMNNFTFGNKLLAFYETIGGGSGAGPAWHGRSGVQCHMTNTRITDVEVVERRYPVLLRQFRLREGSQGVGKYCGGQGIIREFQFLLDGMEVNCLMERRARPPQGLDGGGDALPGLNLWVQRSKHDRTLNLGGKNSIVVQAGDRVIIATPGGGGYGAPDDTRDVSGKKDGSPVAAHPPTLGTGSVNAFWRAAHES